MCSATKPIILGLGDTITVKIEGGNEDASMQAMKTFLSSNL